MPAELMIEAKGLGFAFKNTPIIDDISFTVEKGQFVSFIGPSGCGKTTLLHVLAGIYRSYQGELSVHTDKISFVFQQDTLLPWRTALSNVLLPFELARVPVDAALRQKAANTLSAVGLAGYEDYSPSQLSGGMKKRVELARALVTDPELLILDEPFSSLDIITREKLNVLIRGIRSINHCTIVLVTHSVEEACFLSEKIYVLSPLPAQIINFKTLSKNGSPSDHYLLTPREMEVDREIRRDAKVLWTALRETNGGNGADGALPAEPQAHRVAGFLGRHYAALLIPFELALLYFILSFLKVRVPIPDYVMPRPQGLLVRFISTLVSGTILPDLGLTVYESLAGFGIAFFLTLVLGYGIAKSRLASNLLMPYLIAANTIPSVALAPFLVLWFGFGITPRIVTSVIVIFFPMLISNVSAMTLAGKSMRHLVDFFRPPRLARFLYVELPASLPLIASGVKVSITLSVIGAVVGEFVSGQRGLGALVGIAKASFDVELMFVGLVWLVILGLLYYGGAQLLYRAVARRLR